MISSSVTANGRATALLQNIEDQVVGIRFGHAKSGGQRSGIRARIQHWICLHPRLSEWARNPSAWTAIICGRSRPIQPSSSISSKAFHIPIKPTPPPVG